jgi:NADPH:quinone reductase-like Zn-dependent oxidoreductase
MFIYGALSADPTPLPVLQVLRRHITIRGYELFEVSTDDEKLERVKAFTLDGLASGAFKPQIAKIFPLGEMVEAHRFLESNTQIGKVVVTI